MKRSKIILLSIPFLALLLTSCGKTLTSSDSSGNSSEISESTSDNSSSEDTSLSENSSEDVNSSETSSSEDSSTEDSSSENETSSETSSSDGESSEEYTTKTITVDTSDVPSNYGNGTFTKDGVSFEYNYVANGYTQGKIQWKKNEGYISNNNSLTNLSRITLNGWSGSTPILYVGTSSSNLADTITFSGGYFNIPEGYTYFKILAGSGVMYCTNIEITYNGPAGELPDGEDSSTTSSSTSEDEGDFVYNGETLTDQTNYSGSCQYIYNYTGNYYDSISDTATGDALLKALDSLIDKRQKSFSYKGMFDQFIYTDAANFENLGNGQITSFYSGKTSQKGSMNREHTWPDSRGGSYVEKDPHMVRPTITSENSARGNDFYNESPLSWDPNSFGQNKYRGIAARIIFYCAVQEWENGLKLVDKTNDSWSSSNRTMGKLNTLLKWNIMYPVDDTELLRNNVLYEMFDHCRNPFIDDRNYACKIWGNINADTRATCGIH